jgi:hypothetical protein
MSVESRVEYLLRAAARAEREGSVGLAEILRRMARELQPLEADSTGPALPIPLELSEGRGR